LAAFHCNKYSRCSRDDPSDDHIDVAGSF